MTRIAHKKIKWSVVMVTGVEALEEKYLSPRTVSLGHSSGPLMDPFVHDRAPTNLTQSPGNPPSHGSSARGVQREAWTWAGHGEGGRPRLSSFIAGCWDFQALGLLVSIQTLTHSHMHKNMYKYPQIHIHSSPWTQSLTCPVPHLL